MRGCIVQEPRIPVNISNFHVSLTGLPFFSEIVRMLVAPSHRGGWLQVDYVSGVGAAPSPISLRILSYPGAIVTSYGGSTAHQLLKLRTQNETDFQARLSSLRAAF